MTERSDRSDEVRRASQDEDVGGEQAPAASGELKGQTRNDDEVAAAEAEVEQSRAELTETVEALILVAFTLYRKPRSALGHPSPLR